MSLTITSPSFDRIYTMYAWRDNNIRLVLTQGEGLATTDGTVAHVKAPKFQLRDDRGVIDLTSCEVSLALTRPDGSEDLLACSSASGEAAQGIISCPITASATAIAGQATGEIRVLSASGGNPTGIIKFFGVHFQIHKGVSDAAVAQSMQYSELIEALRKVVSLQTGNVADMDELNNGNLPNGNNPVASGNLKTYLEGNYLTYLGARFAKFTYAHDTHSSGYDADTNPVDVYGDGGVYIDEATDLGTFYIVKNLNGAAVGFLLCASAYGYNRGTQIAVYSDSRFLYRYRHSDGTWDEDWSTVELQSNRDSYNSSDTTYFGISNDNTKYPNSKSVYQFIHANAQALVDVYKAIADGVLLGYDNLTIDKEFNIEKQKIQEYIKLSGIAPETGHEDEIPSGYTAEDYKNYAADTGYEKSVFDLGNGTYSVEAHGRPNKAQVTIPTGGAYLKYKDTVTGREWIEPIGMLTTPDTYIQNLIPNHIYVYQILDANYAVLKTGTAKGTGKIRMINAGGDTYNIRDIGGWSADGGTLKYGVVYRGAELNKGISITSAQQEFFRNALGIRDEIDLRDSSASAYTVDTALGVGVDYLHQEIKYGVTAFTQSYYYATANVIKRIAQDIKNAKPVYIHCQAGADRTALICLFLEAVCGVAQSDIDREYELTTFSKEPGTDNQWGSHIHRHRNSSNSSHLKRLVTEINGMEGSGFNDKVVRHLLRTGVTIDELNTIRFGLIDGNPSKLTNPYGTATITKSLSHISIDNDATSVELYQPYEATLTVEDWYKMTSMLFTMDGNDASSYYSNGKISIPRVTGNIVISATTSQTQIIPGTMLADGAVTEDKLANGSVTIEKLSFDISEVADEITQQMVEEAVADGIIKNFDSITPDKEYNAHSSRVEAYMTLTPKQPNESGTYIALDLNERSEIPNSTSVTIPTGGSKIIICDTVTLNKWSDSVTGSSYNIKNLIPERLYTYLVTNSDGEILVSGGCMAHNQVRFIDAGSMTPYLLPRVAPEQDNTTTRQYFNIRDLGGWDCDGGKLKYGMIYRGCELSGIYKAGSTTYGFQPEEYQKSLFRDFLGIRDEIDLRQGSNDLYTNTETTGDDTYYDTVDDINESAIGACVGYERFSVREYGKNGSSYNLLAEYALPLKRIARDLADGKPVYIHCSAGADRTGTLCMLVEAICGVSRADLDRDYELTSFSKQFYDSLNNIRTRNGYRGSAQPHLWDSLIVYIENNFGNSNDSFRDKVIDFAIKSGVTIEEINTIRGGLIDGIVDNIKHPYIKATISKTLSHAVVDNDVEKVEKYQPFKARVLPNDGYILTSVSVTMGGTDITSTAYNAGMILIPKVTGDITIIASATDVVIPDVSGKADKATTLAGYGITDGQTKIDSAHKLSSDLVDDTNKINKFVTSSEKTTWNGKYEKPGGGIPKTDLTSAVQTSIDKADSALQTPSGGTVGQVLTKTASAAEWKDIPKEYEFVNEIPQNADHSQKYVLPDGFIYVWQDGSPAVPYNANTKIINQRPQTNHNIEDSFVTANGVLCSEIIPFDQSWKYSSASSGGSLANITISGIEELVPAYNSSVIIYYYRRDNGEAIGAVLSQQIDTLNHASNNSPISIPSSGLTFSLMDQNIYFSGLDINNPGAMIGYVRVMIGISTSGAISENDIKNIVINVPFYDTPGTQSGWVSTGIKHPYYIKDSIFDVSTNQKLFVVGDSIAYGYGGSGVKIDSWVDYLIDHNGYDSTNSSNLSESGLGFCTTSTRSHTVTDIVGGTSFASADVVIVALGINDWKNANATLTQLWSGMQHCFNKIRTDNPYCKIYYLLPFNVSFSGTYASFYGLGFKGDSDTSKCYGHTLREFINLIKTKLSEASFKAFDIHVIDMVECAAINRDNITTALFDNLHPSAATQEVLGKEIARFIAQDRSVKDNSNYLTLDTLPIYNGGVQ